MKKWIFLVALTVLLLHGVQDACAAPAERFTKVKVTLRPTNPPEFGASNATPSSTASWANKWLVISVEFTPVSPQKERHTWIDDATMTIRLALMKGISDGRTQPILFTGTSEFWTIPLDNRRHTATMMIPPQILDRYLPPGGSDHVFSASVPYLIEVLFKDRGGAVIGEAYDGQNGMFGKEKDLRSVFRQKEKSSFLTISGVILPRNQTPWASLDVDRFDLLKPVGGRAAEK